MINEKLAEWHKDGRMLGAICDFKANDVAIHYRPYPPKISRETLRSGLELCGMRVPRTAAVAEGWTRIRLSRRGLISANPEFASRSFVSSDR